MSKNTTKTADGTPDNTAVSPDNGTPDNGATTKGNIGPAPATTRGAVAKEEEKETVFIPKMSKNDDALFVAVNGRRLLVKKGIHVEVPKAHAEVIKASFAQTLKNDEFIAANAPKN